MEQKKTLQIYFTSDLHGYFYPTSYATGEEGNMGLMKCAGQYRKDGNTLILDGGDILQGSPLSAYCHDCMESPAPIAHMMDLCGYDYIALGNHDFNFGLDYQRRYVEALNARVLCQNLTTEAGEIVYPHTVAVLENGLRVGLVGVVTDHVNVWEKPENLAGFRVTDPFEAARSSLEELKPQCDLTVCIYHGGFERDLTTGQLLSSTTENIAYRICEELDFDLLLTGHQHMSVSGRDICGTFAVQPSENGREFHAITVTVDGGKKAFSSRTCPADGPCPEELRRALDPVEEKLQKWLDSDVGVLEHALRPGPHRDMAVNGSEIARLFNQIQLDFTGAQISVTSLANEIAGLPQRVHRRDILTTYPYQNTLVTLEMTGAMLRAAMERSAEYFALDDAGEVVISEAFLKPKVEHYNYDYFAGVDYVIDPSRPVGSRVVSLLFEGREVEDGDIFTVCVSDYRASGTGGYPMYPQSKVLRTTDTEIADIIMKYFEAHPQVPTPAPSNYRIIRGVEQ